ncbi:MAG TPA: MATE family efflux transporter [Syntrophales bacterium]|nr:MATE family efflux transporter [Syntrophales bacterium]HOM07368.1 MATE family efflux transporter [Syntrophales bacterium]HON98927.1 MATE family efflux transporter [Syntrophales bacterium]HPC00391.1 MATE family efflux transporter [Syntrophales bacterium]HPQ06994.1 MATE family efflux transporter [Syntrophales bacterium]
MPKTHLDLGEGPILPLLLKMSWPSMAAMLSMAVYNLMDTLWLSRVSPHAIAAFTVTFPIQMIMAAIGIGTGVGAGSFAARMFGAQETDKARETAGQVVFLSASSGLAMILLVAAAGGDLLRLFGARGESLALASTYLSVVVLGAPFLMFMMMSNNLLRAEGRPNLSMYAILTFAVSGLILDPLLIFGIGPFPRMGIVGAACSAIVGQVSACLLSAYFILQRASRYALEPRHLIPKTDIIRSIYQTGFPSVLMNLIVSVVIMVYTMILSEFGHLALAALGICFRINGLALMVIFGIGHGVMPLVGFNYGARQYDRLKETIHVAVRISAVFAGVSSLAIVVFAVPILALFTDDTSLREIGVSALRLYVALLVLVGPTVVWINLFIGLGKGVASMWLMLVRDLFFLVPALYLFKGLFGLTGVWMAQPFSTLLAFFLIRYWAEREMRTMTRERAP